MKNFLRVLVIVTTLGAGGAQAADNPLKALMARMGDRASRDGRSEERSAPDLPSASAESVIDFELSSGEIVP